MSNGARRSAMTRWVRLALVGIAAAGWFGVLSLASTFVSAAISYNSFLESRPADVESGIAEVGRELQRGKYPSQRELGWLAQQVGYAATARQPLIEARGDIAGLCLGLVVLLSVGAAAYSYMAGASVPRTVALALASGALTFVAVSIVRVLAFEAIPPPGAPEGGSEALIPWLIGTPVMAVPFILLFLGGRTPASGQETVSEG